MIYLMPLLGKEWVFIFVSAYLLAAFLYFFGRAPVKLFKLFFTILGGWLILHGFLRSVYQYALWSSGPPGSYFLPPYEPISYFFQYSFTHYIAGLFLTALFITAVAAFFYILQKIKETPERKFWKSGEEYIFFSGALLLRWPLVIPYLFLGIFAAIVYFVFLRYVLDEELIFLNITPFFVVVVPLLIWLEQTVITAFFLTPLLMPL